MSIVHIWCQLVFAIHFFSRTPTSLLICVLIISHTGIWPRIHITRKRCKLRHFKSRLQLGWNRVRQVKTQTCCVPLYSMFHIWPCWCNLWHFLTQKGAQDESGFLKVHPAEGSWALNLSQVGLMGCWWGWAGWGYWRRQFAYCTISGSDDENCTYSHHYQGRIYFNTVNLFHSTGMDLVSIPASRVVLANPIPRDRIFQSYP